MNSNDFVSGAEMISQIFENLDKGKLAENANVLKAWQTTVQKISGNGQQLCDHSRVIDLKKGILLIETDHPAWSQMLQFHKKFILTGLNRLSDGVQINSLAFRVRGSNASLADIDSNEELKKRELQKYSQKLEEQQKNLEKQGFIKPPAAASGKELPPELKEIFDRMKSSSID